MLDFVCVNIILVQSGENVFQQTFSIQMETYCAQLLSDLFLHSEADLRAHLIKK